MISMCRVPSNVTPIGDFQPALTLALLDLKSLFQRWRSPPKVGRRRCRASLRHGAGLTSLHQSGVVLDPAPKNKAVKRSVRFGGGPRSRPDMVGSAGTYAPVAWYPNVPRLGAATSRQPDLWRRDGRQGREQDLEARALIGRMGLQISRRPGGRGRREFRSVAVPLVRARPDEAVTFALFVIEQIGVDGRGEGRIVQLDPEIGPALVGGLGPGGADLGVMRCTA
jgi:hypothetical protein